MRGSETTYSYRSRRVCLGRNGCRILRSTMLFPCLNMDFAKSCTCKPWMHLPATIDSLFASYWCSGLANSSTGRKFLAEGPKLTNLGSVVDQLIEIISRKQGVFRPSLPSKGTCPGPQRPSGGQPVEIEQGPSTSWSNSAGGAYETCCYGSPPAEARHAACHVMMTSAESDVTLSAAQ
jgi:hypothetical protein